MTDQQFPPVLRREFIAQHHQLALKHFANELDDQVMVLKAHLWLEGMLRDFCIRSVPTPKHLQGARLTFKQIFLLARALNPSSVAINVWPAVNHLNSLRNAMAHELEPSAEKIENSTGWSLL